MLIATVRATRVPYIYHPRILAQLAVHGVRPEPTTAPVLVHEFVSDLYRFELRKLRDRQIGGDIHKQDYSAHVVALRRRYILISVPLPRWTVGASPDTATDAETSTPTRQLD